MKKTSPSLSSLLSRPDLRLMLTCAGFLLKAKCLTRCLNALSQLRRLALRPLVQTNHRRTVLALKGESERRGAALCRVTSHLHPHSTSLQIIQSNHPHFHSFFFCFFDIHRRKDAPEWLSHH